METYNGICDIVKTLQQSYEQLIRDVCHELGEDEKAEDMIEKFTNKTVTKVLKPQKNPNRMKKPKTSFLFFCEEKRKEVQEKNPGMKMGEMSKELGKLWKKTKEKSKWENLAEKAKHEYQKAKENDET